MILVNWIQLSVVPQNAPFLKLFPEYIKLFVEK